MCVAFITYYGMYITRMEWNGYSIIYGCTCDLTIICSCDLKCICMHRKYLSSFQQCFSFCFMLSKWKGLLLWLCKEVIVISDSNLGALTGILQPVNILMDNVLTVLVKYSIYTQIKGGAFCHLQEICDWTYCNSKYMHLNFCSLPMNPDSKYIALNAPYAKCHFCTS